MENNFPRVTEILQGAGLTDFSHVPVYILEAAQKFGTAAHKACELWDLGTLNIDTLSAPLIPRLEAWKKFKMDYKIDEFMAIEERLQSAKWQFRGTPDRIYQVNKNTVAIYDIKTAETILPAVAIQMAGYQILAEENYKTKKIIRWSIQLKDDGTYKIDQFTNPHDKSVFISALNIYRWRKENLNGN